LRGVTHATNLKQRKDATLHSSTEPHHTKHQRLHHIIRRAVFIIEVANITHYLLVHHRGVDGLWIIVVVDSLILGGAIVT
jgi:hypothetical protein